MGTRLTSMRLLQTKLPERGAVISGRLPAPNIVESPAVDGVPSPTPFNPAAVDCDGIALGIDEDSC